MTPRIEKTKLLQRTELCSVTKDSGRNSSLASIVDVCERPAFVRREHTRIGNGRIYIAARMHSFAARSLVYISDERFFRFIFEPRVNTVSKRRRFVGEN